MSSRDGRRKTSIQADVSTSTTLAALSVAGPILAHDAQIAFPGATAGEIQNPPGTCAFDELLHRPLNGARVGALAARAERVLEEIGVKHKICPFHVYSVPSNPTRVKWTVFTVLASG